MISTLQGSDKTKATGGNQVAFETTSIKPKINPFPTKWQRVLKAFLSGRTFNRFEAEHALNDHCLHSTVSTLQEMGISIQRQFETVPGYMGIPTRVCRYWLDTSADNLKRAMALLPQYKLRGGE